MLQTSVCADIPSRRPRPWTPSWPHSSFEPLIQLDPDGGRTEANGVWRAVHIATAEKLCPVITLAWINIRRRRLRRHCCRSANTSRTETEGRGVVPRLPLVEKRQEAIRAKKGMRRKWSQYLSASVVKKFHICRIFVCVARCLPFIRLSDDLVARPVRNHQ